jgi:hypothetical protein
MKLSKNFSLEELTKSEAGIRKNIKNVPTAEHLNNLQLLAEKVLQPIRDRWGLPVIINSGYRSPALNKLIGGSPNSQHCKGQAADIEILGIDNKELATWIGLNIKFDQLILEFYNFYGDPNSGWVHVSYTKDRLRESVLTAKMVNKKAKYFEGLVY